MRYQRSGEVRGGGGGEVPRSIPRKKDIIIRGPVKYYLAEFFSAKGLPPTPNPLYGPFFAKEIWRTSGISPPLPLQTFRQYVVHNCTIFLCSLDVRNI